MGKGIAWQAMHNNPVSNAFIVHDLKVISETAERLGKKADADRYRRQMEATTEAYIRKFVSKKGIVAKDYQSAYIMALKFVLPEGELREQVKKNFAANIRKNGLQTGFFATEHLLPLLVEAGETELAYDILLQEGCPGWMYQVKCGATTTWERWDALKPDGTVNEEKMAGADHVYSPKYEKKIKRMLWTEQYFGKHLKLGYALRYAAVFALVVLSMFAANEASARILNVNPWRYIVSFSKGSKMEHNTYQKKPQKSQEPEKTVITDCPNYIPTGFVQTADDKDEAGVYMEWNRKQKEYLQYTRVTLEDGLTIASDGAYDHKEKFVVCGYKGTYYTKKDEEWVIWNDSQYYHKINATHLANGKEELQKMAQSLYLNN